MRKNQFFIFLCICLIFFTACGQDGKGKEEVDAKPLEYYEGTRIYKLPMDHHIVTFLGVSNSHFYYSNRETIDYENAIEETTFYKHTLEGGGEPVNINIPPEGILTQTSHVATDSMGSDALYFLRVDTKEELAYSLIGFDGEGNLLEEIPLQKEMLQKDYPKAFLKLQDGSFAVITEKNFFVTDATGKTLYFIPCPGDEYRGIVEFSQEKLGVSYLEADGKTVSLSIVDQRKQALSVKTTISGDGNLLCACEDTISYMDTKGIYQYDLTTGNTSEIVSLRGRNVRVDRICSLDNREDIYEMYGYGLDKTTIKNVIYSTRLGDGTQNLDPEKYDVFGRRILTLYDYSGEWASLNIDTIDVFNEQSDTYQVVMKDYNYGYSYDDSFDAAKIVAKGDYPDLIFSRYNPIMATFLEKGAIEDITPYINRSQTLALDDLNKAIVEAYTKHDILFALPNRFFLDALYGSAEKHKNQLGWTVDELMEWLAANPDFDRILSTRNQIYDTCIPAILELCIDWKNGVASFDGNTFRSFITKLKALNKKAFYTYEDVMERIDDWSESPYDLKKDINLSTIARDENSQKTKLVIKGYPSADGSPTIYINSPALSIMSNSDAKEGAYEFLEFYLLYTSGVLADAQQTGLSALWTVNRYLNENRDALLKANNYLGEPCTFSERQIDAIIDIIPYAKLPNYEMEELKTMIEEELEPYFENERDENTTCDIIQSRVQLYLDEHN